MSLYLKSFFKRRTFKKTMFVLFDFFAIVLSSYLAIMLRFDFDYQKIAKEFIETIVLYLPIGLAVSHLIFIFFKLYKSFWNLFGLSEGINIFISVTLSSLFQMAFIGFMRWPIPRSFFLLYTIILFFLMMLSRYSYRILKKIKRVSTNYAIKRTLLIGAGEAGNIILKEMKNSGNANRKVVGIIDDNIAKKGMLVQGIKIIGTQNDIIAKSRELWVDEIIIAIPSAKRENIKKIIDICKETGCELKILPGIYQLVNGEVSVNVLRNVEIEDLLARDKINISTEEIETEIKNKKVLVTGGGGSIGSELCRQIAQFNPEKLIIVDFYENNAYEIQNELMKRYPFLNLTVLIASVRNYNRIEDIFKEYKPDIVFHAAAHKHVPLMEESPTEAIKNNVIGTLNVVKASDKYSVKKFILISSDKAVNPTNIMGASKQMCEMIIQSYNKKSLTCYCSVRFGNVLGSNGSVVPLFKKQIETGGPVTVTHPDIVRYFMTIKEAVSLVLQSCVLAEGGELFVLDMGEPVNIAEMAKTLIKLSGLVPDKDIKIEYIGLRPGEKMYEELLFNEEKFIKTSNNLIFIGKPKEFDEDKFLEELESLRGILINEPKNIKKIIKKFVPSYIDSTQSVLIDFCQEEKKNGKII